MPLVVAQPASRVVDAWLDADQVIAIWTLTTVEISSAVQRLLRSGEISEAIADQAERRAAELADASHVVVDVDGVKRQAQRLLRLHTLRAADALQLAAAVEWCAGRPAGRTLYTLDARLAAAARREGFDVPASE